MGLRQTLHDEAPFILVLAIGAAGLCTVIIASQHWLRGVLIIASSLLIAAAARFMLPSRRVGLLAVRGRFFDTACYLALGGAIVLFGLLLPR
jgi:Protein of unknown function (DUF3017)